MKQILLATCKTQPKVKNDVSDFPIFPDDLEEYLKRIASESKSTILRDINSRRYTYKIQGGGNYTDLVWKIKVFAEPEPQPEIKGGAYEKQSAFSNLTDIINDVSNLYVQAKTLVLHQTETVPNVILAGDEIIVDVTKS